MSLLITTAPSMPVGGPAQEQAWYHLQPGSPAINAGTDVGVTEDLEGSARPQGGTPDIGAIEEE
jgi:hypothetical protein